MLPRNLFHDVARDHRQLGDVGSNPPRLVAGEQLCARSTPGLVLIIDIGQRLLAVVAHDGTGGAFLDRPARRDIRTSCPGLWLPASCLQYFGNESILWPPSVHGAAMGTLGKCNPVGQLVDLCQIDIDVRWDQSVRVWASEHQLCQRSLHQSPGVDG